MRILYSVNSMFGNLPSYIDTSGAGNQIWWWTFIFDTLKKVHDSYVSEADMIENHFKYNGQTIYLEKALNDVFDEVQERIYIESAYEDNKTYVYSKAESQDELYLRNKSESLHAPHIYNSVESIFDVDFIVYVPAEVTYDEERMKSIVDQYKLYGKTYKIEVI